MEKNTVFEAGQTRSVDNRSASRITSVAIIDTLQPPSLAHGENWQLRALCASAEVDPTIFYPEKGYSTRSAKEICGRCAVRGACLDSALERNEHFGVWGGLSERERRRLKRREYSVDAS